jgi:hypothetical protein
MGDHNDVGEVHLISLKKNVFLSICIQIIEIDFEIGHISIIRTEPTTVHIPPRTHDWKIFFRSADIRGDLSCLIQRCVFYLHPMFPNRRRGRNIFNKKRNIRYNI